MKLLFSTLGARPLLIVSAAVVALGVAVFGPPEGGAPAAAAEPEAADGEVIAILETPADADRLIATSRTLGYREIARHALSGLDLEMVTLALPAEIAADQAIIELETLEPASVVGKNHVYQPQQSAAAPRRFARSLIGWPEQGCAAQSIGLIDTSVDLTRPAPRAAEIVVRSFLRDGETPSAPDHGADITDVLVGPKGLLLDVTVYAAIAVAQDENGPVARVDHLARAIDWMARKGVRVVNVSLAGPRNKILSKVVGRAAQRRLILVAAAGNNGPAEAPLFPAAFDGAIAVTAVDADLHVFRTAAQGPQIDISAPGVDIWVDGRGKYVSGTSMAAPYVAARLAVAEAAGTLNDESAARTLLASEARDLGAEGRDPVFGSGLLAAPTCD